MTDPSALIGYLLQSPWLVPLLAVAVMCDGPLPFLPSEPVLFSATAAALADGDRWTAIGARRSRLIYLSLICSLLVCLFPHNRRSEEVGGYPAYVMRPTYFVAGSSASDCGFKCLIVASAASD